MGVSLIPVMTKDTDFYSGIDGFTFNFSYLNMPASGTEVTNIYRLFDSLSVIQSDVRIFSVVSTDVNRPYIEMNFPSAKIVDQIIINSGTSYRFNQIDIYAKIKNVWTIVRTFTKTNFSGITSDIIPIDNVRCTGIKIDILSSKDNYRYIEMRQIQIMYNDISIALIKSNNKLYSIQDSNYNLDTGMYNEIPEANFDEYVLFSDINKEVTLGGETFKRLDKFDSFSIVSNLNSKISVNGIKSNEELVIASGDIDVSFIESYEYIKLTSTVDSTSNVKIVVSFDNGTTWYSHDGTNMILLDCIIPLKNKVDMSPEEIDLYNNSKDIIKEMGIPVNLFNSINIADVPEIGSATIIRFAYLIQRGSYNDKADVGQLTTKINVKGSMRELKDSEYDSDIYENYIDITSKVASSLVKINIII